jgi:hypothetical protein
VSIRVWTAGRDGEILAAAAAAGIARELVQDIVTVEGSNLI